MRRLTPIALLPFILLASFVSATAQETAGVVPIKTSISETSDATSATRQLTEIYRVGVGDVLDIRLLNSAGNNSTLFTVIDGGLVELPVAGGAISVGGLTTDEIQAVVSAELKRRAVADKAHVSVGVREYLSHSVTVSGLVVHPGTRFLRREMVPLYVLLAESQLRNDGARVVILRAGTPSEAYDLSDPATLNLNIQAGDIVTISNRPQEFYYVGGRINYPGQKSFQAGITLLQAILAAGGTIQKEAKVEISREGAGGKLVTTLYNLKQIKSGAIEDPKLQVGDRIEVVR